MYVLATCLVLLVFGGSIVPSTMPFKLHRGQPSQPSRAVAWFIATHKLPVDFVDVNALAGETTTPEFTAKNPLQAVPVLELEDGTFLNESSAILLYLTKRFNVKGEVPDDAQAYANVLSAMFSHADLARQVTNGLVRPNGAKLRNPNLTWADITAAISKNEADLLWSLKILEDKLGKHEYIAGNVWTLADYNVAAELSQWPGVNSILPDALKLQKFPNVQKYLERVAQREGWEAFIAPFKHLVNVLQIPSQ